SNDWNLVDDVVANVSRNLILLRSHRQPRNIKTMSLVEKVIRRDTELTRDSVTLCLAGTSLEDTSVKCGLTKLQHYSSSTIFLLWTKPVRRLRLETWRFSPEILRLRSADNSGAVPS